MRVWLHEWEGNEWGWNAWSLDHLGFATWAPSRNEVLARTPGKFDQYRKWLARHGSGTTTANPNEMTIIQEISGNEVAFEHDFIAAAPEEILRCLELLNFSRQDLLTTIDGLPDTLLDWDPPYRRFAEWAWWRTIRQIVEHIAATEIGYYLPNIGYSGPCPSRHKSADWREQLLVSRQETAQFLTELTLSKDRARVSKTDEVWSVRKVLRRLIWHERLHCKSIKRIIRDHKAQMSSSI